MTIAHIPARPGGPWWSLTYRERFLGAAMVGMFGRHNALTIPVEEFPDYVCRELGVDGSDRAAIRQSLRRFWSEGLVVLDGETIRLLYSESALKKYRYLRGRPKGRPGRPGPPEDTQASGITTLRKGDQGAFGRPGPPAAENKDPFREALQKGIRDEHRAQGISPAPRLAPWEYDGGADRVRELVEGGQFADPYEAARALTQATLRWTSGVEPFGPALLQARLPSQPIINITPRDQIV